MKIAYDSEAIVAYLHLKDSFKDGKVFKTKCYHPQRLESNVAINTDFNLKDPLLGFEILGASDRLPESAYTQAHHLNYYYVR